MIGRKNACPCCNERVELKGVAGQSMLGAPSVMWSNLLEVARYGPVSRMLACQHAVSLRWTCRHCHWRVQICGALDPARRHHRAFRRVRGGHQSVGAPPPGASC
ncbi:hypothetical protein EON66_12130, partial [archaeon]